MSRARSPNRDKAFEIYKQHNGEILLKDIATQLGVKDAQIRKWKSQDKWEENLKGTLPKNKRNVTNEIDTKKTTKASKQANCDDLNKLNKENSKTNSTSLGGAPIGNKNAIGNVGGPGGPVGNKKAVTTGEFESIFFDTLEDDEIKLINNIEIEKRNLLTQEIQLLTVRERRMLKRIAVLKNKEMTLKSYKTGIERDADTDLKEFESNLIQIQNIEDALTRIQDKKQKSIDLLHKFDMDEAKIDIAVMKTELAILKQGDDEGEIEDDGFIDALNAQAKEVWDDEME